MHLPERWYQDCLEVHQVDSDGVLNSMSSIEIEDWTNVHESFSVCNLSCDCTIFVILIFLCRKIKSSSHYYYY